METTVSDSSGNFALNVRRADQYVLLVSSLGFQTARQEIAAGAFGNGQRVVVPDVYLAVRDVALAAVTVTAAKPLIERKADRFVVNADKLGLTAGNTMWDVLKVTPLVVAQEQGGLSLIGKESARVYINGRKSSLRGESLYNYLKSLPADNIEKIELITNPGSSFDADGNSGIINIVVKKKITDGYQGRFSLSSVQATYNTQRANGSLNYRKGKLGLSANGYYNRIKQLFTESSTIDFTTLGYANENDTEREEPKHFYGGNLTLGYDLDKRQTLTLAVDYGLNDQNLVYRTLSHYRGLGAAATDSSLQSVSRRNSFGHTLGVNANYHADLDSSGRSLDVMLDYFDYLDNLSQHNLTTLLGELPLTRDDHISTLPQKIGNTSVSINYVHPVGASTKIELGGKIFSTHSDNNLYFGVRRGTAAYMEDESRSNYFKYDELITAAFFSVEQQWNARWQSTAGLRVENTRIDGEQIRTDTKIRNHYYNFFPTLLTSYARNDDHQFSYGLTTRINRPDYWQLNPFRFYQTPAIYAEGNPFLQPSLTLKNEFTYTLKQKYIFLANHNLVTNGFSQFVITEENSDEVRYQTVNYGRASELNLAAVLNESFWDQRITSAVTAIGTLAAYTGMVNNAMVEVETVYGKFNWNNTVNLSQKRKLTGYLTFNLVTPYRSVVGRQEAYSSLDLGVRKQIRKFSVIMYANDVFRGAERRMHISNPSTNNFYRNYYDQRAFQCTVSYAFGNDKLKKNVRKESSNADVKSRTNK